MIVKGKTKYEVVDEAEPGSSSICLTNRKPEGKERAELERIDQDGTPSPFSATLVLVLFKIDRAL